MKFPDFIHSQDRMPDTRSAPVYTATTSSTLAALAGVGPPVTVS